jgi:hypothetical protein
LKAVITTQNLPADLAMQARASKFFNQYAPGQPRSVARPAELPNTDLTNAFDKQQPVAAGSASAFAYGFQVQMWNLNPQAKGFVVGDVKQAGFGWIKEQIEWQAVETAPAQYDFTELDSIVNAAASGGLRVLLSVAHAPTFYRSTTSGLMPADVTTFGRFMQALASRYHGRVQAYELWNEENLAREAGQGNVDPSTYLPLLEAGYTGTKAGDPSALALLGALSPTGANVPGLSLDDLQYLQALFAINNGEVKGFYDAVGAHLSGFSNPPDCMPTTPQCSLSGGWNTDPSFFAFYRLSQYEDTLVRNGDATKTIWLTEFGYDSNPVAIPGYEYSLAVSEDAQARFLVQALQMARQRAYIGGVMIWNLNFQTVVPQTDEKWGFGVIRLDWSARPAYSALAALPKG